MASSSNNARGAQMVIELDDTDSEQQVMSTSYDNDDSDIELVGCSQGPAGPSRMQPERSNSSTETIDISDSESEDETSDDEDNESDSEMLEDTPPPPSRRSRAYIAATDSDDDDYHIQDERGILARAFEEEIHAPLTEGKGKARVPPGQEEDSDAMFAKRLAAEEALAIRKEKEQAHADELYAKVLHQADLMAERARRKNAKSGEPEPKVAYQIVMDGEGNTLEGDEDADKAAQRFEKAKLDMVAAGRDVTERTLFHGTRTECVQPIFEDGFWVGGVDGKKIRNGKKYGLGVYVATSPITSVGFCKSSGLMFACRVLTGTTGKTPMHEEPLAPGMNEYDAYEHAGIVAIRHPDQVLPKYLVSFEWCHIKMRTAARRLGIPIIQDSSRGSLSGKPIKPAKAAKAPKDKKAAKADKPAKVPNPDADQKLAEHRERLAKNKKKGKKALKRERKRIKKANLKAAKARTVIREQGQALDGQVQGKKNKVGNGDNQPKQAWNDDPALLAKIREKRENKWKVREAKRLAAFKKTTAEDRPRRDTPVDPKRAAAILDYFTS